MKRILTHLAIIVAIIAALFFGVLKFLDIYTQHDAELVPVGDYEGVLSQKAINMLHDQGLEGVIDDTVYKDGAKKLSVINQNPSVGQMVKPGRKVYLVINTDQIPMVTVPQLAGATPLNSAKSMLANRHLKVGRIIKQPSSYVRTSASKPVLEQYYHGTSKRIPAGVKIERNSKIDLVIGVPLDYFDESSDSTGSN